MAIVDELVTLLTFEESSGSKKTSKDFEDGIKKIGSFAKKMGVAIVAATSAIGAYTVIVAKSVDETGKFAESINVGVQRLQELEFAIERSGGSVSDLRADLANLTSSMSSPIPGEFNKELFMLGIATRNASGEIKSADKVLLDLSDKFQKFSNIKAQQFGQRLGLSQGTIRLLQQGRDSIAQLTEKRKRLGDIFTVEDTKKSAALVDSLTDMNTAVGALFRRIAIDFSPVLKGTVDTFIDLFLANKSFIKSGITQFVNGLTRGFKIFSDILGAVVNAFMDMLSPIFGINRAFDATNEIAGIVAGTLVLLTGLMSIYITKTVAGLALATVGAVRFALAMVVANAPIIAVIAGVTALVLIVEDLFRLFTGGDSLIGRFFDAFSDRITNFFNGFMVKIKNFVDFIKNSALGKLLNFEGGGDLNIIAGANLGGVAMIPSSIINNSGGVGDSNVTFIINGAGSPEAVANAIVSKGGLQNIQQTATPGINAGVIQ